MRTVTWHTTTLYADASLHVKRVTEMLLGCINPFHVLGVLWKGDCNMENKAETAACYSFNYLCLISVVAFGWKSSRLTVMIVTEIRKQLKFNIY